MRVAILIMAGIDLAVRERRPCTPCTDFVRSPWSVETSVTKAVWRIGVWLSDRDNTSTHIRAFSAEVARAREGLRTQ